MSKKDFPFRFTMRVRWSECDAQGIVYNACYITYIDIVQAEYFRNLGIRLYDEKLRSYFDTATVKATLEYKAPARVDDVLELYTRVSRIGSKSLTMETEMYREGSDELLNRAEMVYVGYDSSTGTSRVVPDDMRKLIGHFEDTGEVLPIECFPGLSAL